MNFPEQLFTDPVCRNLAMMAAEALNEAPLVLTDSLANSVYLNQKAENLLGDRAESLVNRAAWSLLGLGSRDHLPAGLSTALLGRSGPWRGVLRLAVAGTEHPVFIEASAVLHRSEFVCGIIRFGQDSPT